MKRISACLCFLLLAFAMVVPTVAGPSSYFDDMLVALPTEYASYYRMQTADIRTLPPDWADRTVLVPRKGAPSGYALYPAAGVQAITVGVYHTVGSALLEDSSVPGGFRFGFASSPEALRGRAYPLLWDSSAQTMYARMEKGLFSLNTGAYPMPKAAEKTPSLVPYGLNLSASRDGSTFSSSLQYAPVAAAFSKVSGGAYEQFRAVVPQGMQAIKVELCGADSSVFLASVLLEGTNLFDVQKPSPSSSLPDASSSQPSSGAGSQPSSGAASSSKPSSKAASPAAEGEKSTSKFEGTVVYGEKSTSSKSASSSKGTSGTKKAAQKAAEPFSGIEEEGELAAAQEVLAQDMEQEVSSPSFQVLRAGTQRKVSSGVWVTVYTVVILSAGVFVILKQF